MRWPVSIEGTVKVLALQMSCTLWAPSLTRPRSAALAATSGKSMKTSLRTGYVSTPRKQKVHSQAPVGQRWQAWLLLKPALQVSFFAGLKQAGTNVRTSSGRHENMAHGQPSVCVRVLGPLPPAQMQTLLREDPAYGSQCTQHEKSSTLVGLLTPWPPLRSDASSSGR